MNILILEDNPGDADLIKEYLLDATDLFVNTDCRAYLSESLEPIGEGRYDIVLLDLGLPDSQGLNTLEKVLEVRGEQIVIVLTGMSDIEVGVEALKIGAVDYLFKGMMSSSLLVKSIMFSLERFKERGYLRFVKDISEVKYRVKSEILDSSDIDRLLEKICGQLLSVKAVMSTWVGIRYGCGNGFFILVANRSTGVRRLEVKDLGNIICMNSCEERLVKRVMDTSTECQSCFMKDIHEGELVVTSSQKNSDNGCFTVSISLDRVYENYPEIDNFVNDLCLDILNAMGRYRSQAKIIELKEIAERKQLLMEHRLSLIAFAAGSSIPVFLDEVLERLKKLTNSKAGFCYLVNEHKECALSKWSEGSQWEKLHNLIEGTGLLKCCVDSKKPVIENGYRKKGNNRIYRWLMVPVIRNSHVVSIMGVGSKNDFYNDNDIEVLTYIADVTWEIVLRKNSDADNDRLLAAVQQTGEAITVTDTKGVIEYANPAFTDITGYAESELLGCNMRVLDSSIENRDFYAEMLNKIGEGKRWSGQIVNRKKDGNLYTAYLTVSPVTDELGEVINFVAVMRDISAQLAERKEKELLEAQLFQAQKMEAVGRLAGGVAHDFNNILTAISGFAELAGMNTDQDSIAYSDIQEIDAACRRAAGLTRQLLAFSRKDIVKPEILDINELIVRLDKLLGRLIGEDISLKFDLYDKSIIVKADPGQFEQVVINLFVNAGDAIRTGNKRDLKEICLSTDVVYLYREDITESEGYYLKMSVQDTGCGIPEDIIEKVFEPFFTTKEKGKGTGLGMSTVHGIVKQNGGGIKLNSSPDTGTECIVYWPMVSQDNIDDTEGMKTTELFDSDIKVLIVEDDIKLQKIATRMLGNLVSYVECVDSAEKALVVFGNGSFDILFTDVILTGMSGVELAEKLRKTREDLTIIFTSGYTDELLNQTGLDKGEIFFLQKPYSSKDLQKIFNRAYRESRF